MKGIDSYVLDGRTMYAPSGDHLAKWWAAGHWYEQDVLDAMGAEIATFGDGDYVVDAGAHIGNHSAWVALKHDRRVLAFEPNPVALTCLAANTAGLKVTVMGCALGIRECFASVRPGPTGNTGMARAAIDPGGCVEVRRLGALARRRGRVGLIKIDVEGAEPQVLNGAERILGADRPSLIIEAHDATALAQQTAVLDRFGYRREPRQYGRTPTYLWRPL